MESHWSPDALRRIDTVLSVIDSSPMVIFLWRVTDGWPVDYVSGGIRQFGYAPDDFIAGRVSWPGITHPEDVPRLEAEVARFRREGIDDFFQEYRLRTRAGEVRWVDDRTIAIRDADGALVHYAGVIRDITTSRESEQRVQQSESRFRTMLEHAADLIVIVDALGIGRYVSPNVAHVLGYEPEALIGRHFLDYLHADFAYEIGRLFQAITAAPGATERAELRIRHEDGSWVWMDAVARNLLDDPAIGGILVTAHDVGRRVRIESALRESEERFRLVLRNSPILVYTADTELRYTWIYNQTPDFKPEGIVGKRDEELLPAESARELTALKRRVLATGAAVRAPLTLNVGGQLRTYDWQGDPLFDAGGHVSGLTVVAADITPLKRAEDEVRALNAELEARVRRRTAELADSEERYRLLFNAQTHAVVVFDAVSRRVVDASDAALALYGYSRREILDLSYMDLTAEPETADRRILDGLGGDLPEMVLTRHRRKDGAEFPAEVSPMMFSLRGQLVLGAVIRDIGRLADAERALRESESKFRTLAEQSPNMIFINQRGRVIYANPKCVEQMGYSREEFYAPDFDFICLIAPGSVQTVRTRFERRMALEGELEPYELGLVTRDGTQIEAILATNLIDFEGGKAILGIVTDITARKQQEKQSARQQERLERLALKAATAQEEERRRIAYGLHDDVAQIVAACRYKLTGIPDRDAPTTGEIDNLLAAAQERLRTLSFELASSTLYQLGLAPALEELCEIMSARYGVRFDCASRCDLPLKDQVLADILFQSARELLFNVVKHAGVSSANVVLACDDALARLSVEDRGRGFEGDPQNGDTGLGLFGIRQRLRPVDGRLDVRSKPGAFTRITIEIPLSGRAKPPRGIANAHGRRKKA